MPPWEKSKDPVNRPPKDRELSLREQLLDELSDPEFERLLLLRRLAIKWPNTSGPL
jgi:hypothetical protein